MSVALRVDFYYKHTNMLHSEHCQTRIENLDMTSKATIRRDVREWANQWDKGCRIQIEWASIEGSWADYPALKNAKEVDRFEDSFEKKVFISKGKK